MALVSSGFSLGGATDVSADANDSLVVSAFFFEEK